MAKRLFSVATFTPTAIADATTMTNATFMTLGASGATAGLNMTEIYWAGQATASAVLMLQFAREKILAATPGALAAPNSDGAMDNRTAALAAPPIACVAATTPPQRSDLTTQARLNVGGNAFGGVVRWQADQTSSWGITGVTVNVSESVLSAFTGSSASATIGAHIMYEPL